MILECLAYLAAFGGAEYISHYVSGAGGIFFYLVVLLSLIVNAALAGDKKHQSAWLALGLAPLVRIISLALPVMLELSQLVWYVIVSIPILAGIITVMRILKYDTGDVGLTISDPVLQLLMISGGFFLGAAGYYFLKPAAWITTLTLQSTLLPTAMLFIITGFLEEMVFRGVIQRAFDEMGHWWWLYVSAVYPVLQIGQGSVFNCIFSFAVSLYFGYMVKNTKSIVGAGLAHGLINIGLFLLFPHIFVH